MGVFFYFIFLYSYIHVCRNVKPPKKSANFDGPIYIDIVHVTSTVFKRSEKIIFSKTISFLLQSYNNNLQKNKKYTSLIQMKKVAIG